MVSLAVCFPKLAFGTSKIEILRSKSVWGQIFMQIRPKFNDFLAIYEFVMIFSRMARCLVFVDPIFCPPPQREGQKSKCPTDPRVPTDPPGHFPNINKYIQVYTNIYKICKKIYGGWQKMGSTKTTHLAIREKILTNS